MSQNATPTQPVSALVLPTPSRRRPRKRSRRSSRASASQRRPDSGLWLFATPVRPLTLPDDDSLGNLGLRACHDCAAPTTDYRCPTCRKRWADHHHIPFEELGGTLL